MIKTNIKESGFEELIVNELEKSHGYIVRSADCFDRKICVDRGMALRFIQNTQAEEWEKLVNQHGEQAEDKFFGRIDELITSEGVLGVLRNDVVESGACFKLMFCAPETNKNTETVADYEGNVLSVMRQVRYSGAHNRSLDLVVCVNGLPVFTCELKNEFTGQGVADGMRQYKTSRDGSDKLLSFRRCLTHFAVDNEQVYMTTHLRGVRTEFLPFNKGNKGGAGNPVPYEKKYKTAYLWENIWSKDSMFDLLGNFVQEVRVAKSHSGRRHQGSVERKLIFPRYHQLDVVRRLIAHCSEHGSGKRYLIQHSAGSGKSNTIAWLALRLSELHNSAGEHVFDGVLVVTDRIVLDEQLADTVNSFNHIKGVFKKVESSAELREGLEKGICVLSTTIQKFPVIVDAIEKVEGKKFAVIIDEAHSSQSGDSAADLNQVLSLGAAEAASLREERDTKLLEDVLNARMKSRKISTPHVSFFAFTATPKQKTIELFGVRDTKTGRFSPFSLYSMRQAIEEGFILDVLKNYTTYETYFGLMKKIEDDPEFNKKKAQRLLIGYVERSEHAIEKKAKIMIEHFEKKVACLIGGKAKAMVVTKSRLHAVRYKIAFDRHIKEKGYGHKALVAFSGTIKDYDSAIEYTEYSMNKVPASQTVEEFNKDEYRFLIVAKKFQTGFDQPLLSAMYVDKKLNGVHAVQTLSRLNRTAHNKEEVMVLDFVNETDEIVKSFQPYYKTTLLSMSTNPNILYDLEREIKGFKFFSDLEVEEVVRDYFSNVSPDVLYSHIDRIIARIEGERLTDDEKESFKNAIRDFIRKYVFIAQIITFEDPLLERLYIFLKLLIRKLPLPKDILPYEMLDAIDIRSYRIQKGDTHQLQLDDKAGVVDPMNSGEKKVAPQEHKDFLSKILDEINQRYGTNFNKDDEVVFRDMSERLANNEALQGSIKNNSHDNAVLAFNELFDKEFFDVFNKHFALYSKLEQKSECKKIIQEHMFHYIVSRITKP